jgi:hypothetical protein
MSGWAFISCLHFFFGQGFIRTSQAGWYKKVSIITHIYSIYNYRFFSIPPCLCTLCARNQRIHIQEDLKSQCSLYLGLLGYFLLLLSVLLKIRLLHIEK